MTCRVVENDAGLRVTLNANAALARIDHADITLTLYRGNVMESGVSNLWLRRLDGGTRHLPLLGPASGGAIEDDAQGYTLRGRWQDIAWRVSLRLARAAPTWFWHVTLENLGDAPAELDLMHAQDLGLGQYGFLRTNEYYASQYLDHAPFRHARHGWCLATRQNLPMGGRHPWCLLASLGEAVSYATDALQFHGYASRAGDTPPALRVGLPGTRLQHEHGLPALQDAAFTLAPGARVTRGFVACFDPHHPAASAAEDLARLDAALALPEAQPPRAASPLPPAHPLPVTYFTSAARFAARDVAPAEFDARYGAPLIVEATHDTRRASFHADEVHLVMRAKELDVQRAHAQILHTGNALVPDEAALTTTAWMGGVFNSLLTQGHVGINRLLSSARGYLGLFHSLGQRLFVATAGGPWRLLDAPSAWAVTPRGCTWFYDDGEHRVEVSTRVATDSHVIEFAVEVARGAPLALLLSHHVALDDDDGADAGPADVSVAGDEVVLRAHPGSAVGARFGARGFRLRALDGTPLARVGGDELLFDDGRSRAAPYLCLVTAPLTRARFAYTGELIDAERVPAALVGGERGPASALAPRAPDGAAADAMAAWSAILPWFADNALTHYLAPRGLEQFTGGGWGSRDIVQGPLEMLLALGRLAPARDLLIRVFSTQNAVGDWPQWFTFFARDRAIRAGDSHGDIVFWPLLGLARYLEASGDHGLLDTIVPFHSAGPLDQAEQVTMWAHVERALAHIERNCLPGTALISYGHGDWNDSMQPADVKLRDELCSSWTVALHYQMLSLMSAGLAAAGRAPEATRLALQAARVASDFRRFLLVDEIVPGYLHARADGGREFLLHPQDQVTGLRYSLLPIPHAVLTGLLSPSQMARHFELVDRHLRGPDGARLFDKPMAYHGGTMRLFQRAESAAFFGREIGLMYTHAHLRYAEALAHAGRADEFFQALQLVNPIGIEARVPGASPRPSNCYYSSSDAAFADRYAAQDRYDDVFHRKVGFDGGWRVYSSGPGLAIAILLRSLFGLRLAGDGLVIDPVMPKALDGVSIAFPVQGKDGRFTYAVGGRGHGDVRVRLNGVEIGGEPVANPYRAAGVKIRFASLDGILRERDNEWRVDTL